MKRFRPEVALVAAILSVGILAAFRSHKPAWVNDPQLAEGEWSIEVQTPPCNSAHNIQVIYPKESGAPIKIECDAMPVAER